ncbi:vomeronasal type-2 receptor 116-like, partial [Grammomys surdaster]|uniref:vomeronasal type-2 receptor 116-like n=1 Tax=Grammomys surdaster TaxID=491861 RepID=UPI0010A0640B
MKNLCIFTISFWLLKFSLILCSLTEPLCFWRIKNSVDNDGDLRSDCGFVLLAIDWPIEDFYKGIINCSIPARRYEEFLVMFFATDEINKNPYLLPNMSLMFTQIVGMCEDTFGLLDEIYSLQKNNYFDFVNYNCGIQRICNIQLTGPSWMAILKMTSYFKRVKYMTRAKIYDKQIMTSTARVVIIYGEMNSTLEVSFRKWRYLGTKRIWITTSQWDVIINKRDFSLDFFHGTVTFEHHHSEIAKLRDFMQTMNTSKYPVDICKCMLWWNYFNCSISKNSNSKMDHFTSNNTVEWLALHKFDMSLSEEGYNLYNAMYAAAHTYHELILQQVESQKMIESKGMFPNCQQ